jgi:hypothetical protein
MMTSVDVLERYAFVWDGSWPGWILEMTHYPVKVAVALFGPSGPTLAQIKALRGLDETLGALPVREVFARVGKQPRVVFGPRTHRELRRLRIQGEAHGFRVTDEAAQGVWHCLVHSDTGRRIQILDEDEARRLVAAMEARGLPVIAVRAAARDCE